MPAPPVRRLVLATLAASAAFAPGARAQDAVGPVTVCRLPAHGGGAPPPGYVAPALPPRGARALARTGGAAAATFEVTYNGFPEEALAAFQAAVDVWAEHLASPVPIRVEANWIPLGTDVLGSAGPALIRNFQGAPARETWYPSPLADALAGRDLSSDGFDIQADFNSAFDRWHFGADAPPEGTFDLTSVVLHELAHGLGFIGAFSVENGRGVLGIEDDDGDLDGRPFVYDRFTEDEDGRPLLDYAVPSAALAGVLQGDVYFDGRFVRAVYTRPAPLYAPAAWDAGSSYSHLDEQTFGFGTTNALMTPFVGQGERFAGPGALTCAVLLDTGWPAGPGCDALVPDAPPIADGAFELVAVAGGLRLTVTDAQRVRAFVVDALGRRVAEVLDQTVSGGGEADLALPGGLAPGVYFVRVVGETFATTYSFGRRR